jgi:hypothetical protein
MATTHRGGTMLIAITVRISDGRYAVGGDVSKTVEIELPDEICRIPDLTDIVEATIQAVGEEYINK